MTVPSGESRASEATLFNTSIILQMPLIVLSMNKMFNVNSGYDCMTMM